MGIFIDKIKGKKKELKEKNHDWEEEINQVLNERDIYKEWASKHIDDLKAKITSLSSENRTLLDEKNRLNKLVEKLTKENDLYKQKYVHTNLECTFCYTTLQRDFVYCPRCGKKVTKSSFTEPVKVNTNIFKTEVDKDSLLITQYIGFADKSITIPSAINGRPVIGVWNNAFINCTELQEVYFEEGCKYIGEHAFSNCKKLKIVRLPKSLLEIGNSAFSNTAIEEFVVPPNVDVIGSYAFADSTLYKIFLPNKLRYISQGLFKNTQIQEIAIPQSVVHICYDAFSGSRLVEVELPYNLYSIADYAFSCTTLSKIVIHSNVKIIGEKIFGNIKPTVYCSAGSKGLLYAREYDLLCVEISPRPEIKAQICSSRIEVSGIKLSGLYKKMGRYKAETWSWQYCGFGFGINKVMSMEDALYEKKKMEEFLKNSEEYQDIQDKYRIEIKDYWG